MGPTLFLIWYFFVKEKNEIINFFSFKSIIVSILFCTQSMTFTVGISEASVLIVLTAIATVPIFAAFLSIFFLKQRYFFSDWVCMLVAMVGVIIVISDNNDNINNGNFFLGGLMGIITALSIATIFTITRKYKNFSIIPSVSLGSFFSGLIGLMLGFDLIFNFQVFWPLILMGIFVLPMSFLFLMLAPKYIDTSFVSLILLLEMVFAPIIVWLFVDEKPTSKMIIGAIIVFISVLVYILRQYSKSKKSLILENDF